MIVDKFGEVGINIYGCYVYIYSERELFYIVIKEIRVGGGNE